MATKVARASGTSWDSGPASRTISPDSDVTTDRAPSTMMPTRTIGPGT